MAREMAYPVIYVSEKKEIKNPATTCCLGAKTLNVGRNKQALPSTCSA